MKDENIFKGIKEVSLWERIKLLFIKTQYNFDFEDGAIVKYKKMNNNIYILKIEFIKGSDDNER